MSAPTRAQAIIDRCAAIDWRLPSRDAGRIRAAYQRWQSALGLARPIRVITDPLDAPPARLGNDADGFNLMSEGNGVWPFPAGDPLLRTMWSMRLPGTTLPAFAPEWDIAVGWAHAFMISRSVAEETRAKVMGDFGPLLAAVSRIAAADRANLSAMALISSPFLGLFDPPSRVASVASDLLAARDSDLFWQQLAQRDQAFARYFNIDIGGVETPPPRDAVIDAIISLCEPMIEACESGAFAHLLLDGELVVLVSPPIWTDGRRLHRADGPAIAWRETKVYAWKGCVVPKHFMLRPAHTRPDDIRAVRDERVRRALIDLYAATHGHRSCMHDFGGVMLHEDASGRLWCLNPDRRVLPPLPGDIKLVEVTNGTPEADGSRKVYWLNVPPEMQSAQQAVAWTYGMTPDEYSGLVVRT